MTSNLNHPLAIPQGITALRLKVADQEVVFIGDIVHSHTLQFDKPETAIELMLIPKLRYNPFKTFCRICEQGQTIAAPHLPFPGIGHIYSQDRKKLSIGCQFILKINDSIKPSPLGIGIYTSLGT